MGRSRIRAQFAAALILTGCAGPRNELVEIYVENGSATYEEKAKLLDPGYDSKYALEAPNGVVRFRTVRWRDAGQDDGRGKK